MQRAVQRAKLQERKHLEEVLAKKRAKRAFAEFQRQVDERRASKDARLEREDALTKQIKQSLRPIPAIVKDLVDRIASAPADAAASLLKTYHGAIASVQSAATALDHAALLSVDTESDEEEEDSDAVEDSDIEELSEESDHVIPKRVKGPRKYRKPNLAKALAAQQMQEKAFLDSAPRLPELPVPTVVEDVEVPFPIQPVALERTDTQSAAFMMDTVIGPRDVRMLAEPSDHGFPEKKEKRPRRLRFASLADAAGISTPPV